MALPPGLVKKRECEFDWTEEVQNYLDSEEKFSNEDEIETDEEENEIPKYNILSPRTFTLMDILFKDEEGYVNEVGWLLLQNLREEHLRNYQLLRYRREGGGEHRAEQSDCSS